GIFYDLNRQNDSSKLLEVRVMRLHCPEPAQHKQTISTPLQTLAANAQRKVLLGVRGIGVKYGRGNAERNDPEEATPVCNHTPRQWSVHPRPSRQCRTGRLHCRAGKANPCVRRSAYSLVAVRWPDQ